MNKPVDINLTQKSYLTAATSIGNYIAIILVGLVVNPVLLGALGLQLFGAWKICQRLLTYMSGADNQSAQALKLTIAQKQHDSDADAKQRDVGCALITWGLFLPFVLVCGVILSWYSPVFINDLPAEYNLTIQLACLLLVLNLVFTPLTTIPEAIVSGMNQAYRCVWVKILGTLAGGVFLIVAAIAGGGIVWLAAAVIAGTLVRGVMLLWISIKWVDWIGVRRPERSESRKFFSFSVWVLLSNLQTKLMLSSDIIILGLVASAGTVSLFVLSYFSVQAVMDLIVLCASSGMTGLGGLIGRGEIGRALAIHREMSDVVWLMTVFFGCMIILWNNTFVSIWVGPENYIGKYENLMIIIMMTQLSVIRVDARIIDATMDIKAKVMMSLLSTGLSLALAYIIAQISSSKVIGMIIGLMLGRMIMSVSYPIIIRRTLKSGYIKFGSNMTWKIAVTALSYSLAFLSSDLLNARDHLMNVLLLPLSAIIVMSGLFYIGIDKIRRNTILIRLSQIRYRKQRNYSW